jgi:NFU1 iron-sulfur cluster scaffold homolog, mitochondrial
LKQAQEIKRFMKIIERQETPNPAALKFIMDGPVTEGKPESFTLDDEDEYHGNNALAKALFAVGAMEVFLCDNCVSVTMFNESAWQYFINDVIFAIETHLSPEAKKAVAEKEKVESVLDRIDVAEFPGFSDDEKRNVIDDLMEEMVRPTLANDGGGMEVLRVEGNEVWIKYQGACGSCPSSTGGTLRGIEKVLKGFLSPELSVKIT